MANEVLITISKDEIERARLMSELKYELDTQSKLVDAKREGREEGREEIRKEKREVARNALAIGYPLETIHDITGLDMETLKDLSSK